MIEITVTAKSKDNANKAMQDFRSYLEENFLHQYFELPAHGDLKAYQLLGNTNRYISANIWKFGK